MSCPYFSKIAVSPCPCPCNIAYYKNSIQETDEHIIYGSDIDAFYYDELPQAMLHNWSLYNSDSRLISLELLPMNPCANIDVIIYGSGIMTADDGSGYFHDDEMNQSSSKFSWSL